MGGMAMCGVNGGTRGKGQQVAWGRADGSQKQWKVAGPDRRPWAEQAASRSCRGRRLSRAAFAAAMAESLQPMSFAGSEACLCLEGFTSCGVPQVFRMSW